MNKKFIFIIVIVLIIVTIGVFFVLNKTQQVLQPSVTGTNINGILIKKGWTKSFESYCAQGSDYFTLKAINNKELILEFEPAYTETQMSNLSGKNVTVTGEKKSRKIECPEGSQCPATPDDIFTCEVFKINKISESKSTSINQTPNQSQNKTDPQTPYIDSLAPNTGTAGTKVQILGKSLLALGTNGIIKFQSTIANKNMPLFADSGGKFFFVVPSNLSRITSSGSSVVGGVVNPSQPRPVEVQTGTYQVKIVHYSSEIESNSISFTVTENERGVTLLSPNGGEAWQIGDTATVEWRANNIGNARWVEITILGQHSGGGRLKLAPYSYTENYSEMKDKTIFEIPDYITFSDAYEELEPGKYKVWLNFYDKEPCTGEPDQTCSEAKVIYSDLSDDFITISK